MSRNKTHWLKWARRPNESDPDGEEIVVCGNDRANKGSHYPGTVTCYHCRQRMKKPALTADKETP